MKTLAFSIAVAVLAAGAAQAAPANAPRPKDLTNPPPKAGAQAPGKVGQPSTPTAHLLPARQTIRETMPPKTARELGSRSAVGRR